MPKHHPILLVFTLGPFGEAQRRWLLPRPLAAMELAFRRACLDLILALGRACGFRLQVSSPHPLSVPGDVGLTRQRERGFGARFRAALGQAFATADAAPVVAVGTDAPGLKAHHLTRAVELLGEDPERVVLGPCPDGGFYLLAATRPLDEALAATCWCRTTTLDTLIRALDAAGRPVVFLSSLVDLDGPGDLQRWLAAKACDPGHLFLLPRLRTLIAQHRRPWVPTCLGHPVKTASRGVRGRAPPSVSIKPLCQRPRAA